MPKLVFIDASGTEREVDASVTETVMEAAVRNSIPGIDADCGGACACATCHIYVQNLVSQLPAKSEIENDMLEFADNVEDNSRLACQLKPIDGLILRTPEVQ